MGKKVCSGQLKFTGMRKGEAGKPGKTKTLWFLASWLPS
jgi:hypothetical protein